MRIDNDVLTEGIPEHKTADQVADYLQLDKKTIRNWTSEGKIPFFKLGSAVRYPKERRDDRFKSKEKSSSKRRTSK